MKTWLVLIALFVAGCATLSEEEVRSSRITEVAANPEATFTSALTTLAEYGFPIERTKENLLVVTGWTDTPFSMSDFLLTKSSGCEWMATVSISQASGRSILAIVGTVRWVNYSGSTESRTIGSNDGPLLNKLEEIKRAIKRKAEGY